MKYVKDTTGRFAQRPHYEPIELDRDCEQLISQFLCKKYGEVNFPLTTNDLTILLERDCEDLDLYADLSMEGEGVEGVTYFFRGRKPKVCISKALSEVGSQENRFRTTLAHEYSHVRYHDPLYQVDVGTYDLFPAPVVEGNIKCRRDTIYAAPNQYDWMEWQAWYACGAILMPYTEVRRLARQLLQEARVEGSVDASSGTAAVLIDAVRERFQVSGDAARVRLIKLGLLVEGKTTLALLG